VNKNRIYFTVENVGIIKENINSNFAVVSLDFFASGKNNHNKQIVVTEEVLFATADTIKNCPLVWLYDENLDDAYTHDKDEVPCGFVPESASVTSRKLDDGRTMLTVQAYIWKRYSGRLLDIFARDNSEKPVSVELEVLNLKRRPDGRQELLNYKYAGITILGKYVKPAIPLARAKIISYGEQYTKEYEEEFSNSDTDTVKEKIMDEKEKLELETKMAQYALDVADFEKKLIKYNVDDKKYKKDKAKYDLDIKKYAENLEKFDEIRAEFEKAKETEEEDPIVYPEGLAEYFAGEEESIEQAKAELLKEDGADTNLVIMAMFDSLKSVSSKVASIQKERDDAIAEASELGEYRDKIIASQKEFAVDETINNLLLKVVIPEDVITEMKDDSENFSLEDIDAWKNKCKARTFDFVATDSDAENKKITKIGIANKNIKKSTEPKNIWAQ